MFKLIIGIMKFIIELAAGALILACGTWAFNYASAGGLDTLNRWMYAAGGGLVGLFAATAFLGMPILLLQINENLTELNSTVRKIRERRSWSDQADSAPVGGCFSASSTTPVSLNLCVLDGAYPNRTGLTTVPEHADP